MEVRDGSSPCIKRGGTSHAIATGRSDRPDPGGKPPCGRPGRRLDWRDGSLSGGHLLCLLHTPLGWFLVGRPFSGRRVARTGAPLCALVSLHRPYHRRTCRSHVQTDSGSCPRGGSVGPVLPWLVRAAGIPGTSDVGSQHPRACRDHRDSGWVGRHDAGWGVRWRNRCDRGSKQSKMGPDGRMMQPSCSRPRTVRPRSIGSCSWCHQSRSRRVALVIADFPGKTLSTRSSKRYGSRDAGRGLRLTPFDMLLPSLYRSGRWNGAHGSGRGRRTFGR